ncbi:hypothetical protein [Guptibacillus hwajinpoensis]|uniref:Uncharacterized protein n=1 Tax=Guptibacillus hwajinpoensis TaxID=208199 RepID=A0A0J6FYM9_9BACL|nr:hypothetical protein [Alkalihalobacillus macyae]KMM39482.1 hypothetical protein AB986_09900 [Alkalihalobacillus macyae]
MKYLIDHTKRVIHRTTFAGDQCEFHTTPIDKREGTYDNLYLEKLVDKESYQVCIHCKGSIK